MFIYQGRKISLANASVELKCAESRLRNVIYRAGLKSGDDITDIVSDKIIGTRSKPTTPAEAMKEAAKINGLTIKDLCAIWNCTERAVETTLYRDRKDKAAEKYHLIRLYQAISTHGVTPDSISNFYKAYMSPPKFSPKYVYKKELKTVTEIGQLSELKPSEIKAAILRFNLLPRSNITTLVQSIKKREKWTPF